MENKIFKRFRELADYKKVHRIGLTILLFVLILYNIATYFYISNKKNIINSCQKIEAESFDVETSIKNIFVYGKVTCNNPVKYKGKDYAMIRNICIKYDWNKEPYHFIQNNGILYEKTILEDPNFNISYNTDFADSIKLGNMEITEDMIGKFLPYVIDSDWNDVSHEQTFVSVLDLNKNYIFYIESVEYDSISGIQVFENMEEARKELIPSICKFFIVSIIVFGICYGILCIFIGCKFFDF